MIASLWKAEDRTTSLITRRLHDHLQKGLTKDAALRQAKLDLLNDDTIDPILKTPEYWGHLIYIGEYETVQHRPIWQYALPALFILSILVALSIARKQKKNPELTRVNSGGQHRS
ncbi:MAG: hypothetical protein B7Z54_04735 [Sphingobacteriales bacterium 12-47-4]|nr:MAG: hypothetical protein B7Z54_04735 [Sphingobacteriales bacterium 12-47-4]